MARKTKEEITETTKKTTSSASKKSTKSTKVVSKNNSEKNNVKKISSSKLAPISSSDVKKKTNAKKSSTKKESVSKVASAKASSPKTKKATTKKTTAKDTKSKKVAVKDTKTKKIAAKDIKTKKVATKDAKVKKVSDKNTQTKKVTSKTSTAKKTKKVSTKSKAKILPIAPPEYYDLPYRYNQTVVKVLAQNPNTLFVYWDISDSDRENFENKYGKMFFYNTRPVLVVHNLTTNYTFEIDIDDFANNWYINVDNTKCKYVVELGRRPKYEVNQDIPVNYLNVAFSNVIEIPNDHILFFKENDKIYFKNIKTNQITEKILRRNPHLNKVKAIYKNYNLSEDENRFDFRNPSSQNPTSTFL